MVVAVVSVVVMQAPAVDLVDVVAMAYRLVGGVLVRTFRGLTMRRIGRRLGNVSLRGLRSTVLMGHVPVIAAASR